LKPRSSWSWHAGLLLDRAGDMTRWPGYSRLSRSLRLNDQCE
jgi:hypothetical protein